MATTGEKPIVFAMKVNGAAVLLAALLMILTVWAAGRSWTFIMDHRVAMIVYGVCVSSIAFAATLRVMMRRARLAPMDADGYLRKTWYVYVGIAIAFTLFVFATASRRTDDLVVLLLQTGIAYAIISYERHRARR